MNVDAKHMHSQESEHEGEETIHNDSRGQRISGAHGAHIHIQGDDRRKGHDITHQHNNDIHAISNLQKKDYLVQEFDSTKKHTYMNKVLEMEEHISRQDE